MTLPTGEVTDSLDPDLAEYLLELLVAALPPCGEAADMARRKAIRAAFHSMRPGTPVEAMLAAELISGHHVIMECHRIALSPDTDRAVAARARSSAATLSRGRLATLRVLERQQAPETRLPARKPAARRLARAAKPADIATQAAAAAEDPAQEQRVAPQPPYVPRDRFGNAIPLWKWQDMTMVQRRAAYADPKEIGLREEALAEEAVAIAAEAAAATTTVTPPPEAPC